MLRILLGTAPPAQRDKTSKDKRPPFDYVAFEQYMEAKRRFKPNYFLYCAKASIPAEASAFVQEELGAEFQLMDNGLVSAQTQLYLYAHNIPGVVPPDDRKVLVKDILERKHEETGYSLMQGFAFPPSDKNKPPTRQRVGIAENNGQNKHDSRPYRVYSHLGKATAIIGNAGGAGGKTGLYTCPADAMSGQNPVMLAIKKRQGTIYDSRDGATNMVILPQTIDLPNGEYVIRMLSRTECLNMLGFPEGFVIAGPATTAYRLLGNTLSTDMLAHILSYMPGITTQDVQALSIYDGIGAGWVALDKAGATVKEYYAAEQDKHAATVSKDNIGRLISYTGNLEDVENDSFWDNGLPVAMTA